MAFRVYGSGLGLGLRPGSHKAKGRDSAQCVQSRSDRQERSAARPPVLETIRTGLGFRVKFRVYGLM